MTLVATEIHPVELVLTEVPTERLEALAADQLTPLAYLKQEVFPPSEAPDAIAARQAAIAHAYRERFDAEDAKKASSGSVYRSKRLGNLEVVADHTDFDSIFVTSFASWHAENPNKGWDDGTRQTLADWTEADKKLEAGMLAAAQRSIDDVKAIVEGRSAEEVETLWTTYGQPLVHETVDYAVGPEFRPAPVLEQPVTADDIIQYWAEQDRAAYEQQARREALLALTPAEPETVPEPADDEHTAELDAIQIEAAYLREQSREPINPDELGRQELSDLYRQLYKTSLAQSREGRSLRSWLRPVKHLRTLSQDRRQAARHATWVLTGHMLENELPELGGANHLIPPSGSLRSRVYYLLASDIWAGAGAVRSQVAHAVRSNVLNPIAHKAQAKLVTPVARRIERIPVKPEAPRVAIPEIVGSAPHAIGAAARWAKGQVTKACLTVHKQTLGRLPFRVQQNLQHGAPWAAGAVGVVGVAALTGFIVDQTVGQIPLPQMVKGLTTPGAQK